MAQQLLLPALKGEALIGALGLAISSMVMAQGVDDATIYALDSFQQFGAYGLSLFLLAIAVVATNWFWVKRDAKRESEHKEEMREMREAFHEIVKEQKEEIADLNTYIRQQNEDIRKSMATQNTSNDSMLELVKILQQGEPRVIKGGK